MLEIFHVPSIPDSGCQRLGKRRGQAGGGCGYKRQQRDPGGDGMFCILPVMVDTQTHTCDKITCD